MLVVHSGQGPHYAANRSKSEVHPSPNIQADLLHIDKWTTFLLFLSFVVSVPSNDSITGSAQSNGCAEECSIGKQGEPGA